jgi:hypothetical protein
MYNQQRYNQQPSVNDAVTTVLEDGTAAVKDVLGKSWQGLVGFSSRTREAMGQARDQVVTGASVAGQSISAKSTSKLQVELTSFFASAANPLRRLVGTGKVSVW